jgi:hypothetical protein
MSYGPIQVREWKSGERVRAIRSVGRSAKNIFGARSACLFKLIEGIKSDDARNKKHLRT